jgi:hypothetical protein
LELVTHTENMRRASNTILTVEKVKEIRSLWSTGQYRRRDLAPIYGVTERAIKAVVLGQNWKDA